jgi:hypothetical protein
LPGWRAQLAALALGWRAAADLPPPRTLLIENRLEDQPGRRLIDQAQLSPGPNPLPGAEWGWPDPDTPRRICCSCRPGVRAASRRR